MNKIRKPSGEYIKKDSHYNVEKIRIRKQLLKKMTVTPIVCETFGGRGIIYNSCYSHIKEGVVFETDTKKSTELVQQRPTWQVVQNDCVVALNAGVGNHLLINFLDCDPYSHAWHALNAFFSSERTFAKNMIVVVHDALRLHLLRFGGSQMEIFDKIIEKVGQSYLYEEYLTVCYYLIEDYIKPANYIIENFNGLYSGKGRGHTHFFAELIKS